MSERRSDLRADRCAYKDLCLDVGDLTMAAPFWSAALGLSVDPERPRLGGATSEQTVWLNEVAEPKTIKNRVHLDVHVRAVEDLVALGATVIDTTFPWTVMADPEGHEFCAFVRSPEKLPDYRLYELVVDSDDPQRIASWWGDRFGADAQAQDDPDQPWWWLEGGSVPWEIVFAPVGEPKTIKNRVHLDVWGDTAGLVAAGARLLRRRNDATGWDVLADPEGNEFCVFTPAS